MAHFAKLGLDNIVLNVVHVDTIDTMTRGGIEKEEIGVAHLVNCHGHESWKQCSYNSHCGIHYDENNTPSGKPAFRANYPGIGWYYNSTYDIFHPARPTDNEGEVCVSWTLNTTTGMWEPPIPKPTESVANPDSTESFWYWNEAAYRLDNTDGWREVSLES